MVQFDPPVDTAADVDDIVNGTAVPTDSAGAPAVLYGVDVSGLGLTADDRAIKRLSLDLEKWINKALKQSSIDREVPMVDIVRTSLLRTLIESGHLKAAE